MLLASILSYWEGKDPTVTNIAPRGRGQVAQINKDHLSLLTITSKLMQLNTTPLPSKWQQILSQ